MTLRLPTFSQVGRVMACPSSWILPRVQREAGEAAQRGTEEHAKFYAAINGAADRSAWAGPIAWLVGTGAAQIHGEQAIAYDPDEETAIDIGTNVGRAYSGFTGDPYCGSLDAFALHGKTARNLDLKTGRTKGDLWQLKIQSLALARLHGLTSVTACFWYRDGFEESCEEYTWDQRELDGFAEELTQLKALLLSAPSLAPIAEGDHCKYCAAFTACPAKVTLAHALTAPEEFVPGMTALTPAQGGAAWERLIAAESLLAHVRETLEAMARQSPLPLSDGRTVQSVASTRETLDAGTVAHVLRGTVDDDVIDRLLPRSASKAALVKELGKEKADVILDGVDREGGITRKTYYQCKAVKR